MAGTREGGFKTAQTNKAKFGEDYYKKIGKEGGQVTGVMKGFAVNRELAVKAGRKGGTISKRGSKRGDSVPKNSNDNVSATKSIFLPIRFYESRIGVFVRRLQSTDKTKRT